MSIAVSCPACNVKLKAPDQAAGRKLKCPGCGEVVRVPGQKASPAGPAATKPAPAAASPRPKSAPSAPPTSPSRADRKPSAAPPAREESPVAASDSGPWAEGELVEPIVEPLAEETFVEPLDEGAPAPAAATARDVDEGEDEKADDEHKPAKAPDFHEPEFLKRYRFVIRTWAPTFGFNLGNRNKEMRIYDAAAKLADRKAPPIAFGYENASALVRFIRRRNLGFGPVRLSSFFPFRMDIREEKDGPVVFSLRWRVTLTSFYLRIDVCDGNDELMGYFRKKLFSFFGGFWVYDTADRQVAEVKAQFGSPPRVAFVTPEGKELGNVTPFGLLEALETGKSTFINNASLKESESMGISTTIADEVANDARLKVLLVATAIVIEYTGVLGGFAKGR